MWPPILPLFPGMSKSALQYRIAPQRVAAAEAIATDLGYTGAKYPLESAATGAEQMWTSAKYGWEELEETGCVAWALEQQFWQSGDEDWLKASAPALLKIAQFFASRVVQCEPPHNASLFCLNHVMGPDESHAPVNNSGFTSGIAAASIATGIRAAALIGDAVPGNWSLIAENIYLPFDDELRYHPQYDGFEHGTVVRQADVQLLQYPLTYKFPADVASNDMKLYEKSISGPAMTYGLFAVMYMQQHVPGDNFLELAQAEFNKSYGYVYGDFHSFSEGSGGGGTPHFATGMGAFLQSIVQGWAGVRYVEGSASARINTHGALMLRPQMPLDGTTNLTVAGIHYHASALTLSILPHHAQLVLSAGVALRCTFTSPQNKTLKDKVLERGEVALLQLGGIASCYPGSQKTDAAGR
jgi:trehalose/maltose hydrolase-like predicted phosphorylase